MFTAIAGLVGTLISGATGYFKRKQEIKQAAAENRARLLRNRQDYNHEWEMKQLENSGWKDDVLFYAIIFMYGYSAYDPEGAAKVFANWDLLPEWWINITGWLVASVLGVKKVGDYLPGLISGVKSAWKSNISLGGMDLKVREDLRQASKDID